MICKTKVTHFHDVCRIWVIVDCSNSFFWGSLQELMSQIGSPHANSLNKYRFWMIWYTSCKLLGWLSIDITRFGRFCFEV